MNKDQQTEESHGRLTSSPASGDESGDGNPWSDFIEGVVSGVRPFGPALRLLLVTSLGVLAIWLLGGAAIYAAHTFGSPISRFLMVLGEGLLVLGALGMLIGSVRAWGHVILASISRAAH